MNDGNSFLLDYVEDHIRAEDVDGPFTADMRWAYPSDADLDEKLLFVYDRRDPAVRDAVAAKIAGAADVRRFAPDVVGERVRARLDGVAQQLGMCLT